MTLTTSQPPSAGIYWQAVIYESFTLSLSPTITVAEQPTSQFNIHLTPKIGMLGPQATRLLLSPTIAMGASVPAVADFRLDMPANLGMIGGTTGVVDTVLDLTPAIGMTASLAPDAILDLGLAPDIAMDGTGIEPPAKEFDLALAPTIGTVGVPPVTFDAAGAGATGSSSTFSWAHNNGGNGIVVAIQTWTSTSTITLSAKVGSTSMTQIGSLSNFYTASGFYLSLYLFGLVNPPTGSQTITVTSSASVQAAASSVSYNNVGSFGTAHTNFAAGTSASLTVPAVVNDMVVAAFVGANVGSGSFTALNHTSRYSAPGVSFGNEPFIIGDAAGASSVSFTATAPSGVSEWGGIGVALIPA